MTEITRRFFLIGSAATIVAAQAAAATKVATALVPMHRIPFIYSDIMFEPLRQSATDSVGTMLSIRRDGGGNIFNSVIRPGGLMRWVAMPGEEIIVPEKSALIIDVAPDTAAARLFFVYNDSFGKRWSEGQEWAHGRIIARHASMMEVRQVFNIHDPDCPKDALYIGRSSVAGNPHRIGDPHPETGKPMTRNDVCDLFEAKVEGDPRLKLRLINYCRGHSLKCYCKPERCHGDYLFHIANYVAPIEGDDDGSKYQRA